MSTPISGKERERLLVKASEDYLKGRIDLKRYEKLERAYRIDYPAAARALSRRSGRRNVLKRMLSPRIRSLSKVG